MFRLFPVRRREYKKGEFSLGIWLYSGNRDVPKTRDIVIMSATLRDSLLVSPSTLGYDTPDLEIKIKKIGEGRLINSMLGEFYVSEFTLSPKVENSRGNYGSGFLVGCIEVQYLSGPKIECFVGDMVGMPILF